MDGVAGFEENRGRLFGLAYRMLGSAAEAEDVVQEAWIRWSQAEGVENAAAWLTTVVTRLCLNQLTSARARREQYPGPWLPEPVLTGGGALGPLETVEQRESVSVGFLVLLEKLNPRERAVFVLREAFGHPFREIGDILGVDEAYARQLHVRAGKHLRTESRKPRQAVDEHEHARIVAAFLAAITVGDVPALEKMLAESVVTWSDGGGLVSAARRPVIGRDRVIRFWTGLVTKPQVAGMVPALAEINGEIGVTIEGYGAIVPEFEDGRIVAIWAMVNPEKLSGLRL